MFNHTISAKQIDIKDFCLEISTNIPSKNNSLLNTTMTFTRDNPPTLFDAVLFLVQV
jgi:hypothetical protein